MEHSSRDGMLQRVREIVLSELGECSAKIYLFGSWARGTESQSSDIDIAIDWSNGLAAPLATLREVLEESTIPYRIDVVDLAEADVVFVEKVQKEGVLWKG